MWIKWQISKIPFDYVPFILIPYFWFFFIIVNVVKGKDFSYSLPFQPLIQYPQEAESGEETDVTLGPTDPTKGQAVRARLSFMSFWMQAWYTMPKHLKTLCLMPTTQIP